MQEGGEAAFLRQASKNYAKTQSAAALLVLNEDDEAQMQKCIHAVRAKR